jgi:hypothetical protein
VDGGGGRECVGVVRLTLSRRAFLGSWTWTHKVFCRPRPLNLGESECLSGDALAGFPSGATLASENGIMVSAVSHCAWCWWWGKVTERRGAQVSIRRFEGPCRALAPQRVILVSAYAQREGYCTYTAAWTIQQPGIALWKA